MIILTRFNRPNKAEGEVWTDASASVGFEMDCLSADRIAAVCIVHNRQVVQCWCVPYNTKSDVLADWAVRINLVLAQARWRCRNMKVAASRIQNGAHPPVRRASISKASVA